MTPTFRIGNSSSTTRLSLTAGKSQPVAHRLAVFSTHQSRASAVKASNKHAHVPKIVKTQRDEIVLTNRSVEIFTLIVFDPFIFDPLTRLEPADSVRTRAQRPL
jgi:hypothetical protein